MCTLFCCKSLCLNIKNLSDNAFIFIYFSVLQRLRLQFKCNRLSDYFKLRFLLIWRYISLECVYFILRDFFFSFLFFSCLRWLRYVWLSHTSLTFIMILMLKTFKKDIFNILSPDWQLIWRLSNLRFRNYVNC